MHSLWKSSYSHKLTNIAELQRLVTEGMESGVSDRSMDEILKIAQLKAGLSSSDNDL